MLTDIMKATKTDEAQARKIRNEMDYMGLDYSECTKGEFSRAAREAAAALAAGSDFGTAAKLRAAQAAA